MAPQRHSGDAPPPLPDEAWFEGQVELGAAQARAYREQGDRDLLDLPEGLGATLTGPRGLGSLQEFCEAYFTPLEKLRTKLATLIETPAPPVQAQIQTLVARLSPVQRLRGMLRELEGHDPGPVLEHGPPTGKLVSVIVVSYDALDKTRRCLEALRLAREEDHPTEFLFVDNGSRDGSAEYLAAQADVRLIASPDNEGAPRARNRAAAVAHGEWLVFMDNDAMVPPGFLSCLLYHGEVDGRSGCVGPVSDRAAHRQQVDYSGGDSPSEVASFADRLYARETRRARSAVLLTSFCLLVRRAVVETVGGFDERFSPWGFEDDDFSLRSSLAGFRNRVALDTFVRHETYAGPKLERHVKLLQRNWSRFAAKWAGDTELAYGDYDALEPHLARPFEPRELFQSLEPRIELRAEHDVAAPLPSAPPTVPSAPRA